jgi:hypothetical protein
MSEPVFFDPRPISRKPHPRVDQEMLVSHFNKLHPVGTRIRVWAGSRGSEHFKDTIVAEPGALVNSASHAVVKIPGDCIALTHVQILEG